LETAFTNTGHRCFAYDNAGLVAAGRAQTDEADASSIGEVAVLPCHRGAGLGKEILERLMGLSGGHKITV